MRMSKNSFFKRSIDQNTFEKKKDNHSEEGEMKDAEEEMQKKFEENNDIVIHKGGHNYKKGYSTQSKFKDLNSNTIVSNSRAPKKI